MEVGGVAGRIGITRVAGAGGLPVARLWRLEEARAVAGTSNPTGRCKVTVKHMAGANEAERGGGGGGGRLERERQHGLPLASPEPETASLGDPFAPTLPANVS